MIDFLVSLCVFFNYKFLHLCISYLVVLVVVISFIIYIIFFNIIFSSFYIFFSSYYSDRWGWGQLLILL